MAEDEVPERESAAEETEETPSTPFDHPYFLPVLLVAGTLWFGYDGWFNQDMEWIKFNRYGTGFLLPAAVYFTIQANRDVPYLLAGLFLVYAAWLGALGWLGAAGSWFNDTDVVILFDRYGAGFFLVCAAVSAFRTHRGR